MAWTFDNLTPTLDASSIVATMDGWSAELSVFVVSAIVQVKQEVNKKITVHPFIDRTITWRTI